jgi:hypothetical protein
VVRRGVRLDAGGVAAAVVVVVQVTVIVSLDGVQVTTR